MIVKTITDFFKLFLKTTEAEKKTSDFIKFCLILLN